MFLIMQARICHKKTKKPSKYRKNEHESGRWSNSQSWDPKVNIGPSYIKECQSKPLEESICSLAESVLGVLQTTQLVLAIKI